MESGEVHPSGGGRGVCGGNPSRRGLPAKGDIPSGGDEPARGDERSRGRPSIFWRAGQDRRLNLIARWADVAHADVLDVGCGVGLYTLRLRELGARAVGTEIELERALDARREGLDVVVAAAERLPFAERTFDTVLSHEVLEHVADDRMAAGEAVRVLREGGRFVVFVPNRWWPFETHGTVWRGRYRFGNAPIVNYLPDVFRNRLAPHVRVYTGSEIQRLFVELPAKPILLTQVFPGFDRFAARRPRIGRWLVRARDAAEGTPLRRLGLSHFAVIEKHPKPAA